MLIPFLIPFLIAIFLAINIGGSDTAPAFSAAYGSNVIKKTLIPSLFGLMVFIGAIIGGKGTIETMGKEIISPDKINYITTSIIFFSISVSLLISNLLGIPQSTVQTTVLTISSVALYSHSLNTHKLLLEIIPMWFILPVIAFLVSLFIGKYIYKPLRKKGYTISKRVNESPFLKTLIVFSSLYVAFSIGTNNVANVVGPITSMAINEMKISPEFSIHAMILATLIIAPNFAIGSSIFGNKVLNFTGKKIVQFGKIEAVIISIVSASLLLIATLIKGIPTSLVQLNVGAILGIGVAKLGFKNIFKRTEVNKFFVTWLVAPIISFFLSLLLTFLANKWGLLNF